MLEKCDKCKSTDIELLEVFYRYIYNFQDIKGKLFKCNKCGNLYEVRYDLHGQKK